MLKTLLHFVTLASVLPGIKIPALSIVNIRVCSLLDQRLVDCREATLRGSYSDNTCTSMERFGPTFALSYANDI
jgi:hypothetical protein